MLAGFLSAVSEAALELGDQKTLPACEQKVFRAELNRSLEPLAKLIRI